MEIKKLEDISLLYGGWAMKYRCLRMWDAQWLRFPRSGFYCNIEPEKISVCYKPDGWEQSVSYEYEASSGRLTIIPSEELLVREGFPGGNSVFRLRFVSENVFEAEDISGSKYIFERIML